MHAPVGAIVDLAPFCDAFDAIPTEEILAKIGEDGFFNFERAVTPQAVEQILADVDQLRWSLNRNDVHNVRTPSQTFNTRPLAVSKTAFNLVTSRNITDLCRVAMGSAFRMTGARVYETRYRPDMRKSHNQLFHVDLQAAKQSEFDGLAMMLYLDDVTDGQFEFVRGSHLWGENFDGSPERDEEILRDHGKDVVSFLMPRGSIILYHNRGVHRGRTHTVPGKRQSMSMHINRGAHIGGGPIIVDVGFLGSLSDDAKTLLGYGVPPTLGHWPDTDYRMLNMKSDDELRDVLAEAGLEWRPKPPPPAAET